MQNFNYIIIILTHNRSAFCLSHLVCYYMVAFAILFILLCLNSALWPISDLQCSNFVVYNFSIYEYENPVHSAFAVL